ncbi:MAG: hypothetical protein JRF33_21840 [Deltaproteobacteria bacterium]|nr:hypothetical protein [Deltaproteobacteria bacterium]
MREGEKAMRRVLFSSILIASFLVLGCDEQGPMGVPGDPGTSGEPGYNSLVEVTEVEAGEFCAAAGQRIDSGLDANRDGILAAGEIADTRYVCNGALGAQGEPGLQGEQGLQGVQGIQGVQGTQGDQGIQGDRGIQGDQGIQGEAGSQGVQGEVGLQGSPGDTSFLYANRLTVALSGGDFTSIQAAVDSITEAAVENPYLVWIAPGLYNEAVTLSPYVSLAGSGEGVTIIQAQTSTPGTPVVSAAIIMAEGCTLRDLSVSNTAAADTGVAISVPRDTTGVLIERVTAISLGGTIPHAIVFDGPVVSGVLRESTLRAGRAFHVLNGAQVLVSDCEIIAEGTSHNYASTISGTGTHVVMRQTRLRAEGGATANVGLELRGGVVDANSCSFIVEGTASSEAVAVHVVEARLIARNTRFEAISHDGPAQGLVVDMSLANLDKYVSIDGGRIIGASTILGQGVVTYRNQIMFTALPTTLVNCNVISSHESFAGDGNARVSHSRLTGVTTNATDLICVAVSSNDLFYANTCP